MNISLNLIDTNAEIEKKILTALISVINQGFNQARPKIIEQLQKMVREAIVSEPEYQSLLSGQLKYELGIDDSSKIQNIIDIWISNVDVQIQPVRITGSQLSGQISISMIKEDYSDVLSSVSASITDSNTGSVVPWLYWLLLGGGDILVQDYAVKIGPNPRSRTGNAIMVSSPQNWRMPAQYVGVADDNWVYRAISKLDSKIENMMQTELEKSL